MTRQSQRKEVTRLVILSGMLALICCSVLTYFDLDLPEVIVAATGIIFGQYGNIVRDHRNRSDVDVDELKAEESRERRVVAETTKLDDKLLKEDILEEFRKLRAGE